MVLIRRPALIAVLALCAALFAVPSAAVADSGAARAVDAQERYVIGLMNQARAEAGLAPLQLSSVLSAAASDYAHYSWNARKGLVHDADGRTPAQRAQSDYGWPHPFVSEVMTTTDSNAPEDAYQNWMDSSAHRAVVMDPNRTLVGIGFASDHSWWVAEVAYGCTPEQAPACGLTGDYGTTDAPTNTDDRSPRIEDTDLRVPRNLRVQKRKLRLEVTMDPDAVGTVRVTYGRGTNATAARVTLAVKQGSKRIYNIRFSKAGRYSFRVLFDGRAGWDDQRIVRTVTVR